VITATTGNQVLELARTATPSAILLDLLSPEMDSWETARRLREDPELRNTPLVVMSALSPLSGAAVTSGWLRQPVEPAALIESLSHWLSSNGSMQRVLFVTPDVSLGDELRDRSEAKSLSPTVTANLGDALRVLETVTPDAIVLDFMLLDRSGHELIDQLRTKTQTRSIPLVMYAAAEFDASVAHPGSAHTTRAHTEEVAQRIALLLQRMTAPR
jgi:CheY-like chemotaxis protein